MSTQTPDTPTVLNTPVEVGTAPPPDANTGPLDLLAIMLTVILCLSWGLNQVAVKLALPDVPPVIQVTVRAAGATLLLAIWMFARGIKFDFRDGTLKPGILIGLLFTFEYVLIYQGLLYTSASRSVVYLYTAPIFVVIASRWFLPGERFTSLQWIGIVLSFAGIVIAFGEASPFEKPEQALGNAMMVLAAIGAAGTTLVAKASSLCRAAPREDLVLPDRPIGSGVGGLRAAVGRDHDGHALRPLHRIVDFSNCVGRVHHLPDLVRIGAALFREPARRIDVPDAAVRCCGRLPHPRRAAHGAIPDRRGDGDGWNLAAEASGRARGGPPAPFAEIARAPVRPHLSRAAMPRRAHLAQDLPQNK